MTADLDNVLRLRLAGREAASDQRNRHRRIGRDWTAALEAVQQASDAMTATEHRARDIEARGTALAERALEQLKAAEERVRAAEARIMAAEDAVRAAETRALEAEARAQEAEEWLARLSHAIQEHLLVRRDTRPSAAA